jgi:four helix bundle protein
VQDFRQLAVWQKSHRFTLEIYRITALFPQHELYGLTSQMRRAAVSMPSNIAEGCGRGGDREFAQFLQIAMGSGSELEYQLLLAHDLFYIPAADYARLQQELVETKRMLNGLLQKLRTKS